MASVQDRVIEVTARVLKLDLADIKPEHVFSTDLGAESVQSVELVAMFEDKESYRANAESSAQHSVYLTLRACLEDDPEWHDVAEFVSMGSMRPDE